MSKEQKDLKKKGKGGGAICMSREGMVDDQFRQLQSLQEDSGSASGFVAGVATLFIDDADRIINDIGSLLDVGGT